MTASLLGFFLQCDILNSFAVLLTPYNVCSVHRGDTMSTLGGYHEYIEGCSVHRGDIMMNVGGYHEYIGGIP